MPNEEVGMAGSLAKRFPAKPALSVGVSPCGSLVVFVVVLLHNSYAYVIATLM